MAKAAVDINMYFNFENEQIVKCILPSYSLTTCAVTVHKSNYGRMCVLFNGLCQVLLENSNLQRSQKGCAGNSSTGVTQEPASESCVAEALQRTSKAIQDIDALISAATLTWKSSKCEKSCRGNNACIWVWLMTCVIIMCRDSNVMMVTFTCDF